MNAETPKVYDLFKKELLEFISQTEQRHAHLYNWLEFYDQRRTGWAKAFRNPELPKTNKGESGNSRYSAVTHLTGLPLDLGVKCTVAEMHVYAGCRREITTGQYKGGNGPTQVNMNAKLVQETFNRISNTPLTSRDSVEFVADVLVKIGLKENVDVTENEEVPMSKQRSVLQTHKFLADQIQAKAVARIESPKFINAPHKKIMKRRLQFSDTLDDMNSGNQKQKPRTKKPDVKQSLNLNEKILNTFSEQFTIKTVDIGVYEITINRDAKRCYIVNLKQSPTCTCLEFERILKAREHDRNTLVCKHIPCMMLCLGFEFNC